MKIYDRSLTGAAAGEAGRPQEVQRSEAGREARSTARSSGDRVELSGSLGVLARAVSTDRANRASRIEALSAQVESGTYRPDLQAISRNMVSDALARP